MEESVNLSHQSPIPLKVSKQYKIVLKNYLESVKKNFRVPLKQGDVLKLMIDVIRDNNFVLKLHNLKLNKPKTSEGKDVFVVYEETKKLLDTFIDEFSHVAIEDQDSHVNLRVDMDRKFNHNISIDQYVGYIIRLFEYRLTMMDNKEIEKIVLKNIGKNPSD